MSLQTAPSGCFRPVGTQELRQDSLQCPKRSISSRSRRPRRFPPALLRGASDGGEEWPAGARRAFDWFLGENDLQTALIDPDTGSCSDGLHPDRPNENKGAESVLSYLLGLVEMRQFIAYGCDRPDEARVKIDASNGVGTNPPRSPPGSIFVPIPILESPEPCICGRIRPGSSSGPSSRRLSLATSIRPTRSAPIISSTGCFGSMPKPPRSNCARCWKISKAATGTCSTFSKRAPRKWKTRSSRMPQLNKTQRGLIGAYFLNEYSFEASALFNPSIVRHPDQTGAPENGCRFILSLRAVGEGHISSLTFRSGTIAADGSVSRRSDRASRVGPKDQKPDVHGPMATRSK